MVDSILVKLEPNNLQKLNDSFIMVSNEDAARLGLFGGQVPKSGAEQLKEFQEQDALCSPIVIAGGVEVFDFTKGYDSGRELTTPFGIGRYDEDRRGMYEASHFTSGVAPRTIHVGIDIGAAEGTPVFAPWKAVVCGAAQLSAEGDYGGTLILQTLKYQGPEFFMLFGHLSLATSSRWHEGAVVEKGELLGWLGGRHENGGWNPHLHWQLSWLRPRATDLPGAVSTIDRALAKLVFPDPTNLLRLASGGWR